MSVAGWAQLRMVRVGITIQALGPSMELQFGRRRLAGNQDPVLAGHAQNPHHDHDGRVRRNHPGQP